MVADVIDVCIIEDDHAERALLLRRLLRQGYSVVQASDGKRGFDLIRQHHPRIVISDLMLPHLSGIELCHRLRNDPELAGTYLIIVTAYDSGKRKRDALNAGADDYLIKPYDQDELDAKARNGMRICHLQERLRRAALTDGLTGLWNHTHFRELLNREFARARRYGGELSLLMLDLDHFKAINDTYGHEIGNRVLKGVSKHLQNSARDVDTVARYGGEEFTVICPLTSPKAAMTLAERIRASMPDAVRVPEHPELAVYASIGVVGSNDTCISSAHDMITHADQALYSAKGNGRNQVRRCEEVVQRLTEETVQVGEIDRLRKQVVALSMQAKDLCLQSVWALVQALEARDPLTAQHSRNVKFYVERLVRADGWPENLGQAATNAAMLHDLGKIGIPDGILQKPGKLTPSECATLRQVPLITCKILEPLRIFETETVIIRHLRERFDGTGYPDRLAGDRIPIGARIVSLAEAFDSLTSDRAYRPSRTIDEAIAKIQSEAGACFDPQFVELLAELAVEQRNEWQALIDQTRAAIDKTAMPTV